MWLADQWNDYEVIDCSKGEKLERWGDYLLVRPDPQVIWDTPKKERPLPPQFQRRWRMGIFPASKRMDHSIFPAY